MKMMPSRGTGLPALGVVVSSVNVQWFPVSAGKKTPGGQTSYDLDA